MYRQKNRTRNAIIATVILIVIAIIGVFVILKYSYKAVPTVVVSTGTSTSAIIATSTPPPAQGIIGSLIPHLKPSTSTTQAYGKTAFTDAQIIAFKDFTVAITGVVEDSRCPVNARCIQAGTVRLDMSVKDTTSTHAATITLGEATTTGPAVLDLISVSPENYAGAQPTPTVQHTYLIDVEKAAPATLAKCVVGGCSNEICSDTQHVSSCIYRAQNACYATATCARQQTGECGWTPTPALASCIAAADAQQTPGSNPQ